MEGLFEFCQIIDDVDMLGVLVERTVPYYRLYAGKPERVQFIGVPYPLDWTEQQQTAHSADRDLVIELGSAMDSRTVSPISLYSENYRSASHLLSEEFITSLSANGKWWKRSAFMPTSGGHVVGAIIIDTILAPSPCSAWMIVAPGDVTCLTLRRPGCPSSEAI